MLHTPQRNAELSINKFLIIADEKFGTNLAERTSVEFTLKGTCAGTALLSGTRVHNHRINLNMEGLLKYEDEMCNETVPHEVAHLVVGSVWGTHYKGKKIQSHGPEFKRVCRMLGCKTETYHTMKLTPINNVKKWEITSECGGSSIIASTRMKNSIMNGFQTRKSICGNFIYNRKCVVIEIK